MKTWNALIAAVAGLLASVPIAAAPSDEIALACVPAVELATGPWPLPTQEGGGTPSATPMRPEQLDYG